MLHALGAPGPRGFFVVFTARRPGGLFFFWFPLVIQHTVGLRRFGLARVAEGAGKLVSFAASFPTVAVRLVLVQNS